MARRTPGSAPSMGLINIRFPLVLNPGVRFGFVIEAGLAVLGLGTEHGQHTPESRPSSSNVRFAPNYFRFTPKSRPFFRASQTSVPDPQRTLGSLVI